MRDVAGLDSSLKTTQAGVLDSSAELVLESTIRATETGSRRSLAGRAFGRVVVEAAGTSAWVTRLAEEAGHEVLVGNPRPVKLISESRRKTDRVDALTLARLVHATPALLALVRHRSPADAAKRKGRQDLFLGLEANQPSACLTT